MFLTGRASRSSLIAPKSGSHSVAREGIAPTSVELKLSIRGSDVNPLNLRIAPTSVDYGNGDSAPASNC